MVKKGEAEDDPYDLEYRAQEDDAWYSVSVAFDSSAQTLTLKYMCFPVVHDLVFSADDFHSLAHADELACRFRPLSQQVQDHQCRTLAVGTTVCASNGVVHHDLRFFDAVVDAVNHQTHSFSGGEEVCLCTFVLFWLHGRARGTLTSVNIASICNLQRVNQVDPRISAFFTLVKEKITSSNSVSLLDSKTNSSVAIEKNLESYQNGAQEMDTSMTAKSLTWQTKDSWRISGYEQWTSEDEDIRPEPCNIDSLATVKHQHIILINNLEKDLTPSSIKKFIYKKTSILPQAFVFPRRLSDPFARGAIVADCQNKVQILYEFLANPNHLIVSSRGRPWVITEKALAGTLSTTIWNLLPTPLDEIHYKGADEELKIIHSGTESYNRAKKLRDMFIEFMHHESLVCKKLVLEEKKIGVVECHSTSLDST